MVLKQDVLDAFALLGIDPDIDQATATKAYKRQALLHHPDRNHGDPEATQRFQQIGAAWNTCQRHFDNPAWSHVQEPSSSRHGPFRTYTFSKDDDIPLDEDELYEFYMFMFAETLFGRYSRSKGQRYRYQRSGRAGGGVATFSGGFAESQERQSRNVERQRKENEEYEKRLRELEIEIEEEERDRQRLAKKLQADNDRRATALEHAFQAAYAANSAAVQKSILEYDLDVNAPRKRPKQARRQDDLPNFDSLLHVVASHCDETLVMFLIERGAKPAALNKNQLTSFHAAIKAGNTRVVQFIMERRGRSFDGYHPSKAAPSGRTPLQLAIESRVPSMVELLVKDATTHDVEKCWRQETMSEEIKEILRRKKGFTPPDGISLDPPPSISKKSQRQQELAQQKEARIAEELHRATINRQKREERAAKRAEQEREQAATKLAQEQARLKAELEEHQRLEDNRRTQEEARAKTLEEARLKRETEARAQAARDKAARDKRVREAKEVQTHQEREQAEREQAQRMLEETKKRNNESIRPTSSSQSVPQSETPATNVNPAPPKNALTQEERKNLRYAKLKEKRKVKAAEKRHQKVADRSSISVAQQQPPDLAGDGISTSNEAKKPKPLKPAVKDTETMDERQRQKYEEALRCRAEQSARDKERHRRMVEERARANTQAQAQTAESVEYIPLTPISTHTTHNDSPGRSSAGKKAEPSLPPNIRSSQPLLIPQAPSSYSMDFSLPVEDIQTCVVPDDLFRDERPILRPPTNDETFATVSQTLVVPVKENRPHKRPYRFSHRRQPASLPQQAGGNA